MAVAWSRWVARGESDSESARQPAWRGGEPGGDSAACATWVAGGGWRTDASVNGAEENQNGGIRRERGNAYHPDCKRPLDRAGHPADGAREAPINQ